MSPEDKERGGLLAFLKRLREIFSRVQELEAGGEEEEGRDERKGAKRSVKEEPPEKVIKATERKPSQKLAEIAGRENDPWIKSLSQVPLSPDTEEKLVQAVKAVIDVKAAETPTKNLQEARLAVVKEVIDEAKANPQKATEAAGVILATQLVEADDQKQKYAQLLSELAQQIKDVENAPDILSYSAQRLASLVIDNKISTEQARQTLEKIISISATDQDLSQLFENSQRAFRGLKQLKEKHPDLQSVLNKVAEQATSGDVKNLTETFNESIKPRLTGNDAPQVGLILSTLVKPHILQRQYGDLTEQFESKIAGGRATPPASEKRRHMQEIAEKSPDQDIQKMFEGKEPVHEELVELLEPFVFTDKEKRQEQRIVLHYNDELQRMVDNPALSEAVRTEAKQLQERLKTTYLLEWIEVRDDGIYVGEEKLEGLAPTELQQQSQMVLSDDYIERFTTGLKKIKQQTQEQLNKTRDSYQKKLLQDQLRYLGKVESALDYVSGQAKTYISLKEQGSPEAVNVFDLDRAAKDLQTILQISENFGEVGDQFLITVQEHIRLLGVVEKQYRPINYLIVNYEHFVGPDGKPHWPGKMEDGKWVFRKPNYPTFIFRYIDPASAQEFMSQGETAEEKYFSNLLEKKAIMIRQPAQFDLPELSELHEFYDFVEWKYGKTVMEQRYRNAADLWQEVHNRFRILIAEAPNDETLLKILSYTPEIIQWLKSQECANIAISLYEQEIFNLMAQKLRRFTHLKNGEEFRRKRLSDLKQKMLTQEWRRADAEEYFRLYQEQFEMDQGVMMWDEDVLYDYDKWSHLVERERQYEEKKSILLHDAGLPDDSSFKMSIDARKALMEEVNSLILTTGEKEYITHQGFSNMEASVKKKLELFIKNEIGQTPEIYVITRAVRNAAIYHLLRGNTFQVAAMMTILPSSATHMFRAHSFERMIRIINPRLFEKRFMFGGLAGYRARAFINTSFLERRRGLTKSKLNTAVREAYNTKYKELRNKAKEKDSEGKLKYPQYQFDEVVHSDALIHAAKIHFGIPYEELVVGGFPNIGGRDQLSYWAQSVDVYNLIVKDLLAKGMDPSEAFLSYQLQANPHGFGNDKEGIEKKREIMRKMARRAPNMVCLLDPTTLDKIADANPNVDLGVLQEVLFLAQQRVNLDMSKYKGKTSYIGQKVDLSDGSDFEHIVKPYIIWIEKDSSFPMTSKARAQIRAGNLEPYRRAIVDLIKEFDQKIDNHGWAEYAWPITLQATGFDLTLAEYTRAGGYSQQRRSEGDIAAAMMAGKAEIALTSDVKFMYPQDWKESCKKIHELHEGINAYLGKEGEAAAFQSAGDALDLFIEQNYWKTKGRWSIGLLPFSENITRLSKRIRLTNFSSNALYHNGSASNLYKEGDVWEILCYSLDQGFINQEIFDRLVKKYKCSLGWRLLAAFREKWWVLPILFGYLGYKQVEEDEKRKQ